MEKNMEDIFNLPSDTKPMVEVLKDSRQIIEKLDAQNDENLSTND